MIKPRICIDVGGTKTAIGVVYKNTVNKHTITPTLIGKSVFPKFLKNCVKTGVKIAQDEGYYDGLMVYIGLPGNFPPGRRILVKKGSGMQIITKNEKFDQSDITDWILTEISNKNNIYFINDALSQAIGGVRQLWSDVFKNKRALYVGPGTGLGGALIDIGNSPTQISPIGDGHIYDVMIKGDDGEEKMAEDRISGRYIHEKCDVSAKEISESDELWRNHYQVIDRMGDDLVTLILTLMTGKFKKNNNENNWVENDQLKIKDVDLILLGGSIATRGRIGEFLLDKLKSKINLPILPIKDTIESALIGLDMIDIG